MLRKPVKPKAEGSAKTSGKNERFKFLKLEDRIAPKCFFNENAGKPAGGCGGGWGRK